MAQRLKVVPPGLFASQMGIDGHVTGSARERLALTVRNVYFRFRITVVLSHTKIYEERVDIHQYNDSQPKRGILTYNVNSISVFMTWDTDQEVVRLDITVDQ